MGSGFDESKVKRNRRGEFDFKNGGGVPFAPEPDDSTDEEQEFARELARAHARMREADAIQFEAERLQKDLGVEDFDEPIDFSKFSDEQAEQLQNRLDALLKRIDNYQANKEDSPVWDVTMHVSSHADYHGDDLGYETIGNDQAEYVDFSNADLEGTTFDGTRARHSEFMSANLDKVRITNDADLSGSSFDYTTATSSDLDYPGRGFAHYHVGIGIENSRMDDCSMLDMHWKAHVKGTSMRHCRMDGSDLTMSDFEGCDLTRTSMTGARVRSEFHLCRMDSVDFTDADLNWSPFVECSLRGADFQQAKTGSATNFIRCDLSNADFRGTGLKKDSECFGDCNLDGALFD